jgi:putative methyltransferase (TIGR04325 family)
MIKNFIKNITPPIILKLVKGKSKYGFFGNYKTWQEVQADSKGYDDKEILEKVKNSLLKVKNGEAVYERDSVLFDEIQYSWPVLSSLLWVASQNDNRLNLIDFGGSLGSSYFQNIGFLKHFKELRWNIVEQKNFVECGKKYFENDKLKFYEKIDDCFKETKPNAILISSVIQYLEKPYDFLKKIANNGFEYVIFDRTTFLENNNRLTLQKISPRIYDSSYPAWFLNEKKFLDILLQHYKLVADFDSLAGEIDLGDIKAFEKGFIFQKQK